MPGKVVMVPDIEAVGVVFQVGTDAKKWRFDPRWTRSSKAV
jgi:hypothetical protein